MMPLTASASSSSSPPEPKTGKRDVLEKKFSLAATHLTDLYRESTNAYEAGYHDALLYVHRYILLTTATHAAATPGVGTAMTSAAPSTASADNALSGSAERGHAVSSGPAEVGSLRGTVRVDRLLHFLHASAERRRQRVNAARGAFTYRRRPARTGPDPFNRLDDCDQRGDADQSSERESSAESTNGVSDDLAHIDTESLEAEMWEMCMPYQRRRLEHPECD